MQYILEIKQNRLELNPYRGSAQAPEKEIGENPKTELFGEMFCYKRKRQFREEVKKNENMT